MTVVAIGGVNLGTSPPEFFQVAVGQMEHEEVILFVFVSEQETDEVFAPSFVSAELFKDRKFPRELFFIPKMELFNGVAIRMWLIMWW